VSLLYEAARDIQRICRASGWQFCFIGGIAVQRWGEPRFTHDADLTLLTGFGNEAAYIERLLEEYDPRAPDAASFALKSRVLLLKAPNGIPIDVSLGAIDFEARMIQRASDWDAAEGVALTTCGADDLVVLKAFAGRDQDWVDIRNIATRQSGKLDADLIFRELEPLLELKEDAETEQRLRKLFSKA